MNTLPKSLHTVTTLAKVAQLMAESDAARGLSQRSPEALVASAIVALGYNVADDAYGLRDVAARKLARLLSK